MEGRKTIETRTFQTSHRGPLLICSGKEFDESAACFDEWARGLEYGKALAVVQLLDCRPMTEEDEHAACIFYAKGRYAWVLGQVDRIDSPFPVRGMPGLFEVEMPNGLVIAA